MLGICHEEFLEVQRIFNHNFSKYEEIGSSLCVSVDGEIVVDIWAGHKNKNKTEEWSKDTLSIAFSSTTRASATARAARTPRAWHGRAPRCATRLCWATTGTACTGWACTGWACTMFAI